MLANTTNLGRHEYTAVYNLYLQYISRNAKPMQRAHLANVSFVVARFVIEQNAEHDNDASECSEQSDGIVKERNGEPHCEGTFHRVTHTTSIIIIIIIINGQPHHEDSTRHRVPTSLIRFTDVCCSTYTKHFP